MITVKKRGSRLYGEVGKIVEIYEGGCLVNVPDDPKAWFVWRYLEKVK